MNRTDLTVAASVTATAGLDRLQARATLATATLVVLGLLLLVGGIASGGPWATPGLVLGFLVVGAGYWLQVRRTWSAAGRG